MGLGDQTRSLDEREERTISTAGVPGEGAPGIEVGAQLGRYRVDERIGSGGMGVVFRARDLQLDRVVALKCLHAKHVASYGESRLAREAQGLAQLSHPNVVGIFDVEHLAGSLVLAMEFVKGPTLRQWLRCRRPADEILDVMVAAGRGLVAAHEAGLIHRDFKPSNVILGDDGRVRVMDFGLVRADRGPRSTQSRESPGRGDEIDSRYGSGVGSAELTEAGLLVGTVPYMSPEQLIGDETDDRSDQYAFCVTLWEAMCGRRPFSAPQIKRNLRSKLKGPPPWPPGVAAPRGVVAIVRRGLSPDAADRWPSMVALIERIESVRGRPGRRRRAGAAAGGALIAGVALAAGLSALAGGGSTVQCVRDAAKLDGAWGAAKADGILASLRAAGPIYERETWPRVQERLDAYATRWLDVHVTACEATNVRQEASPEELDHRMACLERARSSLREVATALASPEAELASRAITLVAELPRPARCLDPSSDHESARLPVDPVTAAEVDVIRDLLVEARIKRQTHEFEAALAQVDPLVARAEATGFGPVIAESLYVRGRARLELGELAEGRADLERVYALAMEHELPLLIHASSKRLAFVVGHRLVQPEAGMRWAQTSVAQARRIGDPALEASSRVTMATVLHTSGRYDEAVAEQRRALESWFSQIDQGRYVRELDLAEAFAVLANMVDKQGRGLEAIELHRLALEIQERNLGPHHLIVAQTLGNLASVVLSQEHPEEAVPLMRRTLAIREEILGPDHAELLGTVNNLGIAMQILGRYDEAEPYGRRALELARAVYGEAHPYVASALLNLGRLEMNRGAPDRAYPWLQQSLSSWTKAQGPEHPGLAKVLDNLGLVVLEQGRPDQALEYFERSRDIRAAALGEEHPLVALSTLRMGKAASAQGRPRAAEAHARRALALSRAHPEPDREVVAEARELLADVQAARGEGRPASLDSGTP